MYILLLFTALTFDLHKCAKPRSVNLALETVLEFDKNSDITLVDTVQNFLTKIRSTIEESRRVPNTRRGNTFKFSDFFEESVGILRSFNDIDLKYLLKAVEDEVDSLEQCKDEIDGDFELRRYVSDKLFNLKNVTGDDIRRNLDNVFQKLRDEEYKKNSVLIRFLNSLFGNKNNKFEIILNDLQLFRRRGETRLNLRSIVKNTVGIMVTDYYCSLKRENRKEIQTLLNLFMSNPNAEPKRTNRKPRLRIDKKERNNTILNNIQEQYNQYRENFLKVQNYYNIKDSWNSNTNDLSEKDTNRKEEDRKYKKIVSEEISVEKDRDLWDKIDIKTTTFKTNLVFENNLALSSKEFKQKKSKKRKHKTTKKLSTEINLEHYLEPKENLRLPYKTKEAKIKRKKDKKKIKPNKIFLEVFTTASEVKDKKQKKYLNKLLSRDDESKSNEDLPVWQKQITKSSENTLKTFITLYPENIDIYNQDKKTTEGVRKRFKIKHNNRTTDRISLITTNAEIDIDIDASILKTSNLKGHSPQANNGAQNAPQRKFRGRKNKKKLKHRAKKHRKTTKPSNMRAVSKDSGSIEYFGSLYSYRNKHKNEHVFRKSNDKDLLQITNGTHNVTTRDKDNADNITTVADYSDETTRTYGTLAFWSGTERSTFTTVSTTTVSENMTIDNVTQSSVTIETKLPSTQIVFRSHTFNESEEKPNKKNNTDIAKLNITSSSLKTTTNEKQINVTTPATKTTVNTTVAGSMNVTTTRLDLRRYLENLKVESDLEDGKRSKVENRIREDLLKLLKTTPTERFDEIDELEDAFKI